MKLNNISLVARFNLVLVGVLAVALATTGVLTYQILQRNARQEVIERAGMMMEAALAVRGYTISEIRPLLALQMKHTFLPQTVPAYAATQALLKLRETHAEFGYKEATLNPTNPRNRTVEWEADIVERFRNQPNEKQLIGLRETPSGPVLYLARPIQIKDPACLVCHSTVDVAPKTMLTRYGTANGFGWKLNEIVGAQIMSVPMSLPIEQARTTFYTFMGTLVGVFVAVIIILNIMLRYIVVRPVVRMARAADDVSRGKFDTAEFPEGGTDEISVLAASFNRMRRSLEKAMKMLDE